MVRDADVEEMDINELNVLGENRGKVTKQKVPLNGLQAQRPTRIVTEGGVSPLLSIGNEGENKLPLNTNISATGQEIFMIEDAGGKSSKDGRTSSIG